MATITIQEEIKEFIREYNKRQEVYPKQVQEGKLTKKIADKRQGIWVQIIHWLREGATGPKIKTLHYSLDQMIDEVLREIKAKEKLYPSLYKVHQLDKITGEYRIACTKQTLARLEAFVPPQEKVIQKSLFD